MRRIRKAKQKGDVDRQAAVKEIVMPFSLLAEGAEASTPAAMAVGDKAGSQERLFNLGAVCHAAPLVVAVETKRVETAAQVLPSRFPERVRTRAREVVMESTLIAGGVGLVPVPLLDVAGMALIIGGMLKNISNVYGCRNAAWSKNAGVSLLAAMGSVGGGEILAGLMLRLIPGGGLMLAAASLPMSTAVMTYSLGMAAIRHFESKGSSSPPSLSVLAHDAGNAKAESESRVSALIGKIGARAKA